MLQLIYEREYGTPPSLEYQSLLSQKWWHFVQIRERWKEDFCKQLKDVLKNKELEFRNIKCAQERWEMVKLTVKEFSITYSKTKSKNTKKRVKEIENRITKIENRPFNEINNQEKYKLERELQQIYDKKLEGAYIRSRANWIKCGEKCSSYFLKLENKHQQSNVIEKIDQDNQNLF